MGTWVCGAMRSAMAGAAAAFIACGPVAAQAGSAQPAGTAATGSPISAAASDDAALFPLTRLTGPVRVDGVPDEAAWRDVPQLPLTMYAPTFRGEPSQRSEIRVAYDDEYLYAAGWFYDTDPDGIRINSLYRDHWNGDDAFAIYVDAFNDNQNAKWFGTTPAGMRFDLLVSDDGGTLNESWDTFWDAEATVTEDGWFVEVRIPFSSLGFQPDASGRAVMGLTVTRLVSRTGERVTFPAIDPRFAFRQPSVARDVELRDVRSPAPLYLTPYVLAGVDRRAMLNADATGYAARETVARKVGLDARYALSGTLTLDLTANTDFAQVEADDEQVNLDRFSLFFPEKRRFFQERSGIFELTTGAGSRLFHSRQIGLTADREPVPVLGGARLVGRVGTWDVGLLDMQTESADGSPGENFGVVRVRRNVLNPYSYAGAMVTTRLSEGRHNVVLGADGVFRVAGDQYVTIKAAGSADVADPSSTSLADRSHVTASLERRVNDGLFYSLELTRSGSAYRPDLGFLPRTDFTRAAFYSNWFFRTDDHPVLQRIWPGVLAFSTYRNEDGALESGQYAVWAQWDTKSGGGGWIEPKVFVEDVFEPFTIGDAEIPAGRYTYADLQVVLRMADGRKLRATVDARAGTFFDGTRQQVIVTPTWNVSRHVEVGGRYQLTRLGFDDRGQATDIQLARLRVRTALNARASGNAFVQYNSVDGSLDVNVRLRYNVSEGTDLWVVYNEGLNTDRFPGPGIPDLPVSDGRSLIIKYTHTFEG